jgi:hypothetical protein
MSKRSRNSKKNQNSGNVGAPGKKKNDYWKAVRIGAFFGIIEVFSLVLWVKSEDFTSIEARHIRWFAACGFLAGGAFLAHKLIGGKFKKVIIGAVWIVWLVICAVMFGAGSADSDLFPALENSSGLSIIIPCAKKINILKNNSIIDLDNSRTISVVVSNSGVTTSHVGISFATPLTAQDLGFSARWQLNHSVLIDGSNWNNWVLIDTDVMPHFEDRMEDTIFIANSFNARSFPAQIWLSSDNTPIQSFNVIFRLP